MNSKTWRFSQEITERHILPEYWQFNKFNLSHQELDFCSRNASGLIEGAIRKSDIFVFQNCLNELSRSPNYVPANLGYIFNYMPTDSIIVIADQTRYSSITRLLSCIKNHLNKMPVVEYDYGSISLRFPEEFINYLPSLKRIIFSREEKLSFRKNINFQYLIIKKIF